MTKKYLIASGASILVVGLLAFQNCAPLRFDGEQNGGNANSALATGDPQIKNETLTYTIPIEDQRTNLDLLVSVPRFNGKGTLKSVQISAELNPVSSFTASPRSGADGSCKVDATFDFKLEGLDTVATVSNADTQTTSLVAVTENSKPSIAQMPLKNYKFEFSNDSDPDLLAAFVGKEPAVFHVTENVLTSQTCSGNISHSEQVSKVSGFVTITYNPSAVNPVNPDSSEPVPEKAAR